MTRGIKTSEFWTMAGAVALTVLGMLPPWSAPVAIGAFQIARGLAKAGVIRGTLGEKLQKAE